MLEELFYYTYDEESRYITDLKNELKKDGYITENGEKILGEKFSGICTDNEIFIKIISEHIHSEYIYG